MSDLDEVRKFAVSFAVKLINAEYAEARSMLTPEAARDWPSEALAQAWVGMFYEDISPVSYMPETVAVDGMAGWENRQPGDVGWAYVPVLSEDYNEAVTVVITRLDSGLAIRDLQFGRP